MTRNEEEEIDELRERVEELEDYVELVDDKHQARVDQTVKPKQDDLADRQDEAAADRAELWEVIQDLQQRQTVMDQRLESIAGLADDQETNPQKRVSDLREAMIRRAEARGDTDEYERISMWWREVQDLFADYGHGEISKPDCYKAMDEAKASPGFSIGKKQNENGNAVKAIRLDLAELRAESGSRNPTTPTGATGTSQAPDPVTAEGDD